MSRAGAVPFNGSTHAANVLVQFDEGDYNGESCLDDVPRVVPIYAEKHRFTFNGVEYEREMLPLTLSLADTVHWPVRRFRTRADLCRSEPSHKAFGSLPHWS